MICRALLAAAALFLAAPSIASDWHWNIEEERYAKQFCTEHVLERLLAPETAAFGDFVLASPPTEAMPASFEFVFEVQSQNAFGVVIPIAWRCSVGVDFDEWNYVLLTPDYDKSNQGLLIPTLPYRPEKAPE